MPNPTRRVFHFGPYELLTAPTILSRQGELVAITPKALGILSTLVLKHGQPVSKDVLLATVWPGTVVEEASLSQNIYLLRRLLAADFPSQTTIENIPRVGYRFSLKLEEVDPTSQTMTAALSSSSLPVPTHPVTPDPILSGPSSSSEIAEETLLQAAAGAPESVPNGVTQAAPAARKHSPRSFIWSTLASALVLLMLVGYWQWPALRTVLRRQPQFEWVRFTANSSEDRVTAAGISPDGNLVAYADADGVMLRAVKDETTHALPSPQMKTVDQLVWFPDQLHILLSGENVQTGTPEIWKISVLREQPVLLRSGGRAGVVSHSGSEVAFLSGDRSVVSVLGAGGENPRQILSAGTGGRFSVLVWGLHDDGLLVEQHFPPSAADATHTGSVRESTAYERVNLSDGKVTASQANFSMGGACVLASGDLLFSQATPQAGQEAIALWKVSVSPGTGALGKPVKLFEPSDEEHIWAFTCSGNGEHIATLHKQGAVSVYVGTLAQGNTALLDVQRLSLDSTAAYPHGWSSDSEAVLYEARRTEHHWQIFSHALNHHDPDQIISMSGANTRPTPTSDHRWLLFFQNDTPGGKRTLYRVAPQQQLPFIVPSQGDNIQLRCPLLRGDCVVMQGNEKNATQFFVLDPVKGRGKLLATLASGPNPVTDWDVSPDGTTLVVVASTATPLHLVSLQTGELVDVPFHAQRRILAVNWTADGKGFFAASENGAGSDVSFVDLAGHLTFLRTASVGTWMVPSPDGKRVAFIDRRLDSNVWLLLQK